MARIFRRIGTLVAVTAVFIAIAILDSARMPSMDRATGFWLPGGLGIAAVLILGPEAVISAFVASFITAVVGMGGRPGTLVVASALAVVSGIQAWSGSAALKRFAGPLPPATVRHTLRAVGICMVTPLISAIAIPAIFVLAGFTQSSNYTALLIRWWLGGATGILIIVPVLVVLSRLFTRITYREPHLWLLVSIMVSLSLFAFSTIREWARAQMESTFARDVREMQHFVQDAIDEDLEAVKILGAYYESSEDVDKNEFLDFSRSILLYNKDIQALIRNPRVSWADRAAFEGTARRNGIPDFQIRGSAADSDDSPTEGVTDFVYPALFVAPHTLESTLAGLDFGSNPVSLAAILQARDSGNLATSPAGILGSIEDFRNSILAVVPLYSRGNRHWPVESGSVEERRRFFSGTVIGIYHPVQWVYSALETGSRHDIDIHIFESERENPKLVGFVPSLSGTHTPLHSLSRLRQGRYLEAGIVAGDMRWRMVFRPGPKYTPMLRNALLAWGILFAGLGLTAIFIAFVASRHRSEAILERSEAEFRALADYSPIGIIRQEASGKLLYVNQAILNIFGCDSIQAFKELSARFFSDTPDRMPSFLKTLQREGKIQNQEVALRSSTGEERNILFSAAIVAGVVNASLVDITERQRVLKSLNLFSRIIDQIPDIVSVTDISGTFEYVNPAFEQVTGYRSDEIVGKTPSLLKSGSQDAAFYRGLWQSILAGDPFQADFINRKKDGSTFIESKTITPVRDATGMITNFVATGKDITATRMMENRLRELQREYTLIAENSADVIWILDLANLNFVYASPSVSRLLGYSPEELLALPIQEMLSAESNAHIQRVLGSRLDSFMRDSTVNGFLDELLQIRKDGSTVPVEVTTSFAVTESGGIQVVGISRDISERKTMELALRERVKELTCLFEVSRVLERADLRDEELCTSVTESLGRAMQYSELAVSGMELFGVTGVGFFPPEDHGDSILAPIVVKGKDYGRLSVFYREPRPLMGEERSLVANLARMIGLWLERRNSDTALRESNERFIQLVSAIEEVFWIYDLPKKTIVYVSPAFEKIWGRSCESLYARPEEYLEGVHPEDRHILKASMKLDRRNQVTECTFRVQSPEGVVRWVWDRSFPIRDTGGKVTVRAGVCTDITDLKTAQDSLESLNRDLEARVAERTEEVRQRETVYRALFENSNDGIFIISPEGMDLQVNQRGLDMLGYSSDEYFTLARENPNFIAAPEQSADADHRLHAALQGDIVPPYERSFVRKDGTRIQTEINLSVVRNTSGEPMFVQSVVRDITERRKAELAIRESRDKLSAANAALEKASRMKDEFLASMSHELRTPLTGILGLSEVLQLQTLGALNEKQIKAVRTIETSGRHLLELINDILDLSKIEAGKLDMQFELCNAGEVCTTSIQLVRGMAHQKKQNVDFDMQPSAITLQADPRRLKQMLVNLLSNAIKFTPERGRIGLDVRLDTEARTVRFTVWDEGIGIAKEDLPKLFKPFVQLDSSLARQYSGTGLGLSLVQRMAELHAGGVIVESEPGKGSRFTILLPWGGDVYGEASPEGLDAASLRNAMVIEDNDLDAARVARHLKDFGIAGILQPVLRGALEKAAILQPSAILLDINLPDGSGLDFLADLKRNPSTQHIPVIMLSVEDCSSRALALGALGFLLKPYDPADLRKLLGKAATIASSGEPVMIIEARRNLPVILMADDNELILETVSTFLNSLGYCVITVRSGVEFLEIAPEIDPDIALVDIQMPGMDGMETIRRFRAFQDKKLASIPIIAVTALAMTGDKEKCLAAGASDYVSKPFSLTQLARTIRSYLRFQE